MFSLYLSHKLENVAINPKGRPRHRATANLNCFGARDTSDLVSMVSFTFDSSATLFGWQQRHLPLTVWQSLLGFCLLTSVFEVWQ